MIEYTAEVTGSRTLREGVVHLVVIGGSDAGISAALRARECDPSAAVTLIVADTFPNFSICGLPFFHSGEVPDWHSLAHRTIPEIEAQGINLLLDHTATVIDATAKRVRVITPAGQSREIAYDRLVVGTGSYPVMPPIAGLDVPGVFTLHTMGSTFALEDFLVTRKPQSAIVIGAGYIGTEMADALTLRGLRVTLVGRNAAVLPTIDPVLGHLLEAELARRGVTVVTGQEISAIVATGTDLLTVTGAKGFAHTAELVLVVTGVRPTTDLAVAAGATIGQGSAIQVNQRMGTGVPDIFAAGDCAETFHRLLGRPLYLPLGTTSHKQGRVADENAVGGDRAFAGVVSTQVVKVFDLAAARTGLLHHEAEAAGFVPVTVETIADDHKRYYPGAVPLHLRVTGDRHSGQLLGAQIVGHWKAEVAKRIDVFAAALYAGMTVEAISDLDLSYTPPLGSPWDAVQMATQAWSRAI